jgi:K+-transporting ATPase ATPase A chain
MTLFEFAGNGTATMAAGGAMEGKETRFGIIGSTLFGTSSTLTSTGAVNSMHDSYTALGGGMAMINMMLGEVAPGGVGSGLYGILVIAIIAVFIAGLMVGRTPEYLGKKLGAREMKLASLYILATPTLVLVGTALSFAIPAVRADIEKTSMWNPGLHGFSEVLYAFTSAGNNNGSAFAGLTANTPWLNSALGVVMMLGRFLPIVFALALAGSLAAQDRVPATAGTLPTHRPQFIGLLIGTVILVSALTYFPVLALGPLAEGLK